MKGIKDDELLFAEFALMKKAREHIQELTATEKMALKAMGIFIMQDQETGKNIIV